MHAIDDSRHYFAMAVSYLCKIIMKPTPGLNAINILSPSLMVRPKKPEHLSLANVFQRLYS
jgi:hypothetical protein